MLSKYTSYIIIILAAATILMALGTYYTYRNSLLAVEDSLKLQSLGIAISLEPFLLKLNPGENIFRDIVTEGRWEGIAFIALYDGEGTTLLHSNEKLINKKVDDEFISKALSSEEAVYDYTTLGTGEEIFILNFPLQLNNSAAVLRLGLHSYPFEKIIRQANFQAISAFIVIVILWITGYFFVSAVRQAEALSESMEEKSRLTMLGEMSSVLAHEIRNPLGSIKGFAQFILEQEKADKKSNINTEEYLNIIISESKRLEALTDELLLYAKISEYKPEQFKLPPLVSESLTTIQANIDSRHIDFRIDIPEDFNIRTDYNKLKQILINIIQNSVESISDKGLIEITAKLRHNNAEISVQDNGSGMVKETRADAFKPFFTTKTSGTGLGLAIVERLTKSIGGKIELHSEPLKGTKFKIIIPGQL